MIKVNKDFLENCERKLFHNGLIGGGSILPFEIENGLQVKKSFYYSCNNRDLVIRFYYKRLENGIWGDLIRIQFKNYKNGKITTYYCE